MNMLNLDPKLKLSEFYLRRSIERAEVQKTSIAHNMEIWSSLENEQKGGKSNLHLLPKTPN